ncbi:MAG: radical SAM protein [Candidatus Thorarchaeota archaeon]
MTVTRSGDGLDRVAIVDGYVDEPTCLGVTPYMSPYPRYIAGAIWTHAPRTQILYHTIDQVRESFQNAISQWVQCDIIILIAGMIVPGKYIGGTPISVREARELFSDPALADSTKILVGPWARFGCGLEGGRIALSAEHLFPPFDYIISGDPEITIGNLAADNWNLSNIDATAVRPSSGAIADYAVRGARIVNQHPHMSFNHLICEIETYRGCARFLTGGCSFCVEPSYGEPDPRRVSDIAREIQALHSAGVTAFRIGMQADLFTYGSHEMGLEEFPTPNPSSIEELFSKIRSAAPKIDVLHIDNVNPGTIARHPEESRKVAKIVMKYHTPGDVAAFGVESLDPEVIRRNNLKATEEEVMLAVRTLNEEGGRRPPRGLPHLLPGINLLYGLPGERRKTLEYNTAFLHNLVDEGLMVRRINIRQVIGLSGTRLETGVKRRVKRNEFFRHKEEIRQKIDRVMIERVAPQGTILRRAFVESEVGNRYLLRQLGTYPLLCSMPKGTREFAITDVFVVDHGPRSLTVLPYPLRLHDSTLAQWKAIPGMGGKRAARIKAEHRVESIEDIERVLDYTIPAWLGESIDFAEE